MPKSPHSFASIHAQAILDQHQELKHLRVRAHGKAIIIESGPNDDPIPHARLRQVTTQYWQLEMPTHRGRWEPTPVRGTMADVLKILVDDFAWTLAPVE